MELNKNGFTIVELLVVMMILGIVTLTANNLFFYTLKGGKKTDIQTKVKQNGSYALSSMATRIRNAVSIVNCQPTSTSLTLKPLNGDNIIFSLSSGGQIASNTSTFLTTSDLTASALSFSCTSVVGKPPLVGISFSLAKTSGSLEETATAQTFQTTVSLRSY